MNPKGANSPTLQSWGEKGTELGQRSPQVAPMSLRCQEQRGEHRGSPQGGGELLGAPQSEGLGTSGLLAVRERRGLPPALLRTGELLGTTHPLPASTTHDVGWRGANSPIRSLPGTLGTTGDISDR